MHPYAPQYPEVYNQQIQILTKGIPAAADAWGQKSPKERGRFLKNDAQALIASTIAARDWSGCADILPAMKMPCLLYASVDKSGACGGCSFINAKRHPNFKCIGVIECQNWGRRYDGYGH